MIVKKVHVDKLKLAEYNPRKDLQSEDVEYQKLEKSINHFGYIDPIVWNKRSGNVVGGHQRLKILINQGLQEIEVSVVDLGQEDEKTLNIALNKISGEWDENKLKELFQELDEVEDYDKILTGFDVEEIERLIKEVDTDITCFRDKLESGTNGTIFEDFVIPPFSIFDTRQGYWQNRKKYWIDSGIRSETGRGENITFNKTLNLSDKVKGTSIFDPVLCEIIYRWFNIDGGSIIDPFAGGSVRGIMAGLTGHSYTGVDLRKEQIQCNIENAKEMGIKTDKIKWICGNSVDINEFTNEKYDMLFTCPPYFDLEVYSDHPEDLSNMDYNRFEDIYTQILSRSGCKVRENRFAVVVISDVRDKKGFYRDLVGLTKRIFHNIGFKLYNEIILLNVVGSGAWRSRRNMKNRKVVRLHQNVLVFFNGKPEEIQHIFPELKAENEKLEEIKESLE